jgi:uncharacterized protein
VTVRLEDSRVLLTGATGGIGRAIAGALRGRGAELVISGRRAEALDELRTALGGGGEALAADLSEPGAAERLAQQAGDVDVLVANAGLPAAGRLDEFVAGEIDRALQVNLRAPLQLARALVPAMLARGSGHVVLISSLVGKVAYPANSVYCATKFGLRGFGRALHEELRGSGVGVTTIFPGFVREAGMFVASGAKLPMGMGTSSPQDVANAVVQGIERGNAEIDVAPLAVRSGVRVFTAAPSFGAAVSRVLGGSRIAASVAQGHREKH